MKKIVLVLLTFFLVVANGAAKNTNETPLKKELRNEIEKLLTLPEFTFDAEIMVATVEFMINKKGEIVVLSVESENADLENFIKNRLNYHSLKNYAATNYSKFYSVPVKIVTSF